MWIRREKRRKITIVFIKNIRYQTPKNYIQINKGGIKFNKIIIKSLAFLKRWNYNKFKIYIGNMIKIKKNLYWKKILTFKKSLKKKINFHKEYKE